MGNNIEDLVGRLKGVFKGELLRPQDPGYAEARLIWNATVIRTPALIARCTNVSDVQAAVRAAAATGVLTAVRCGGHSLAGFSSCDNGLVIDLSAMRDIFVDEHSRRAYAAGGCLLGTIDSATQQAGLVYPSGVVSHTGAAGLILGGGTGWLTRMFGMSCDNVEQFTLVTSDGSVERASARENTELFWALRGGGGNFGIVTEFALKLHPLTSVMLGSGLCFYGNIVPTLRYWRDFMPDAPDELKWNISLRLMPDAAGAANGANRSPVLSETVAWFGEQDAGQDHLDRIFSIGNPTTVSRETVPYLSLQTMADAEFPHGRRYYTKSGYFKTLGDDSIQHMLDALPFVPSASSQIELVYLGGVAGRVGPSETAFGSRAAPYIINILADWQDASADAENISWVRNLFAKLRAAMQPGVYVNFMSADEEDRVKEAYSDRWDRLVAVKTHYDAGNFFRLNQNIRPLSLDSRGRFDCQSAISETGNGE
ncbi:MAG: FAD-dependent oxidoreductase [Candidatus Acidiferrales bacterium]